jgi:hypothetical protein
MFDAEFFDRVLPELLSEYRQQRNLGSPKDVITTAFLRSGKEVEFVAGRWTSGVMVFHTPDDTLELMPLAEITRISIGRRSASSSLEDVWDTYVSDPPEGGTPTLPYLSPVRKALKD